jgi:hypothetical protein
MTGDKTLLNEV